jgi:lipoprotein-releasing system permease protein
MPRRCAALAGPTGIRLKFADVLDAPRLARLAQARTGPGLQVRDWTQENEAYFRAIRIEKTMMGLILMLIVAVAVFNIVATLVMVVTDKRTDIAILRTLGLSPRGVLGVFMTQGVLIGWIGTASRRRARPGTGAERRCDRAGAGEHIWVSYHGSGRYYIASIPSEMHPLDVVLISVAALLLTFLATIYPSLRAAGTAPAEALRYE